MSKTDLHARELPATPGARKFKALLAVLWIASIAGLALTGHDLIGTAMSAGVQPQWPWRRLAAGIVMIAGWGLVAWISYRGTRRNLAPPTWSILLVVALQWAVILLNRQV